MPRTSKATPVLTRIDVGDPARHSSPQTDPPTGSPVGEDAAQDARALDPATLEWLETDGHGGFACGTVSTEPTRRYHALLVGRPPGSAKRHVYLSRLDERVLRDGEPLGCLSTGRFAGHLSGDGAKALTTFELAPHPRWTYRFDDVEITREVLMPRDGDTVLVRYAAKGERKGLQLELRPLLPMREADALTIENDVLDESVELEERGLSARPYPALPAVHLAWDSPTASFVADPTWYKGLGYAVDRERGYPHEEDQFSPGTLRVDLDDACVLSASVAGPPKAPRNAWRKEDKRRRTQAAAALDAGDAVRARLQLAADDFLYRTPEGRLGVTAGFPWFGEWGRDTFLALPGLTLARGEVATCAEALSGALEFLRDGLLPNVFGTGPADSAYNSADASLWFARAVALLDATGEEQDRILDELLPALEEIGQSYRTGTSMGIGCDASELLAVGTPEHNPTWMDARTDDGPVTPRDGFPVEINALWYLLLDLLEDLHGRAGNTKAKKEWSAIRRKAKRAFLERFWLPDEEFLADGWKDGAADSSVRPNMVIAAALHASPLTRKQRAGVVHKAEQELLCEQGLRTLAPGAPAYVGRYEGGPRERDQAYHQGTVWPWLLGFYGEAKLRATTGTKKPVLAALRAQLAAFEAELDRAGLNHVSEVFDGDEPRRPAGTFAQAWNTAELLRLAQMCERGRP